MNTLAPEKIVNGSSGKEQPRTEQAHKERPPRARILAAAHALFYKHGIHVVSVDQIAEAASSNKMTLYRHFKSKDELVAECTRECAQEWEDEWKANIDAYPGDPLGALRNWCREIAQCLTSEERGCFMANAAVELTQPDHPARRVIEGSKRAHRDALAALAGDAGFAEPEKLGDSIFMTMEGARVCNHCGGEASAADRVYAMLDALISTAKRT